MKLSPKRELAIWHSVQERINESRIEIVKLLKQNAIRGDREGVIRQINTVLMKCDAANAAIEAAKTGERQ